jgi:TatD-related deoxyribonuclease
LSETASLLQGIPVTDDHVHFRPDGRMREALGEFHRSGGRRLVLVHTPYDDLSPARVDGFEPGYERTLFLAARAREVGDVEVLVVLGPHPVDLLGLAQSCGMDEAVHMMRSGLEAAQRHVLEGRAVAIGEIGRPHFPVDEETWRRSNELMAYGMELAKEADCAVVLHTEQATPAVFKELAYMADRVGIQRERVIKHYSDPLVLREENHDIFPSVIAKGDNLRRAAEKGLRFLMETDYLDDPRRPGAVLGLGTVPRRCARLLREEVLSREDLFTIHEDNLKLAYGDRVTSG